MGCDIHVCVDWTERYEGVGGVSHVSHSGHFFNYLDRDYRMFELIAGVRGDPDQCLFGTEPRGFPNVPAPANATGIGHVSPIANAPAMSDTSLSGLACRVVYRQKDEDDADYARSVEEWRAGSRWGYASPTSEEDARRYIDQWHMSYLIDWRHHDKDGNETHRVTFVTDPDIHSVSWITLTELEYALYKRVHEAEVQGEADKAFRYLRRWFAVLGYMRALGPETEPRLVFGFDN